MTVRPDPADVKPRLALAYGRALTHRCGTIRPSAAWSGVWSRSRFPNVTKNTKSPGRLGTGKKAQFKHKSDVQKWLDIIRGGSYPRRTSALRR